MRERPDFDACEHWVFRSRCNLPGGEVGSGQQNEGDGNEKIGDVTQGVRRRVHHPRISAAPANNDQDEPGERYE